MRKDPDLAAYFCLESLILGAQFIILKCRGIGKERNVSPELVDHISRATLYNFRQLRIVVEKYWKIFLLYLHIDNKLY